MPKGPRLQENLRKLSASVQSSKWPVSDGSSMVSTLFVPNKRTFITFLTWGRTCTLLRGRSLSTIQRTEVRFASFFSGWFITVLAVNPPESKLAKCTSVGRIDWGWEGLGDYKSPCLYCSEIKVWMLICTIHKQNIARHRAVSLLSVLSRVYRSNNILRKFCHNPYFTWPLKEGKMTRSLVFFISNKCTFMTCLKPN